MVENSNILLPPGGQRILVVMAHPDDAEFLCGGTIARLTAQGCEVSYLLATRGQRGSDDPAMTPERLAVIREAEQRRAAEVLGVRQVLFLDYVDGDVEPSLQMRREIARMVRLLKPEVVFTFDPWQRYQVHPDHRAVGLCTLDALAASRNLMYYPEQFAETGGPHRVRQIYFFASDQPNHWVDISAVIDRKVEALLCHASQMRGRDAQAIRELVLQRGRPLGSEHGFTCAEAFHHLVMN
ncbi:MAG: PIG-L family deacetylase [Thermogemmatispora sp.]|jgi:LmbE family N-acetylglucosaminyl deacetylase|uniref:PIG-L deacetylase family protein n=1 Tax=Thermogemmatispora sp. TaxID=1968838 RepID=UPI0019E71DF7|nr:PIG-L deacetylase family protein [Thermogemmatispora sp.]MBE3566028.1 PIG-L family deacetylase [Thermogemmatispora sp.]